MRLVLYLALPLVLLLVTAVACRQDGTSLPGKGAAPPPTTTQPPSTIFTQVDQGQGGVTVEATWVTPDHLVRIGQDAARQYPPDQYVLVHLKLDTHSVDLARYDMLSVATLSGMDDSASVPAAGWIGVQEDSHHREGYLAFPGGSNGQWEVKEKIAKLRLKDVGGVPQREYVWEFA